MPENERNALLSDETKQLMYEMHTEDGMDAAQLAEVFKVRQQRVMAILALKEMEHKAKEDGEELHEELADIMENDVFKCYEAEGVGERHVKILPQQPKFKFMKPPKDGSLAPGDMISEVEDVEEQLAEQEESHMIQEFREKLAYNTGKVGANISRKSRAKHAPERPKDGWSLVVNPIGSGKPYVAQPDGGQRDLTEDEELYLQRQKPRARRRVMP